MNVKWTVEALNDLEEIELFIAKDNIDRALSFVNELIDFGDSLGNFANKGTQAKWTNDTSVKEMYYKDYTFIYEINSDSVIIHEIHNFAKMIRHFNK
ncbi:MAG: type II toxin-antitoxin system RelE/ParE family toxin [Lachnospiraceae bacterium]|jgi:plasmid stabilization system protein ParE|nr:type II toxin-antitoxin system RelE/ParE family toxin [Lachnospiraceae bacterium]